MRKVKVTAEVVLDVLDPAALERAALTAIDAAEFTGGKPERSDERARVTTGSAAAAEWLIDPFILADGKHSSLKERGLVKPVGGAVCVFLPAVPPLFGRAR